jgi:hypothetical protein
LLSYFGSPATCRLGTSLLLGIFYTIRLCIILVVLWLFKKIQLH